MGTLFYYVCSSNELTLKALELDFEALEETVQCDLPDLCQRCFSVVHLRNPVCLPWALTVLEVGYGSEQAEVLPSWSIYSIREKPRHMSGTKCFEEKMTKATREGACQARESPKCLRLEELQE